MTLLSLKPGDCLLESHGFRLLIYEINFSNILSLKRDTILSDGTKCITHLVVIIMFLVFLPNIHYIEHKLTQYIILVGYIIIPTISITLWIHKTRYFYDNILLALLWITFLLWAFTVSLINLTIFNRIHIGYLLTVLLNIFIVAFPYTNLVLKKLSTTSMIILLFLIITLVCCPQVPYIALRIHPNAMGIILVLLTIAIGWHFETNSFVYAAIVIFNLLIIGNYTKSRSAILMLASYLIIYCLWPSLAKGKFFRPWLIFHSFVFLSLTIPTLTIYAHSSEYATKINEISRELTNKNFFSGRERIWSEFFKNSANTMLMGEGLVKFSSTTSTTLSLHNAWLNLLGQVGLVGVVLFIGILICIWKGLLARKSQYFSRIAASFLASFMLQQNFELSLFQNNLGISLWLWIIVGFALAQPPDYKILSNRSPKGLLPINTNARPYRT